MGEDDDLRHAFWDAAAAGPSVERSLQGKVVQGPGVDDVLSVDELNVISGVYKVYTGQRILYTF